MDSNNDKLIVTEDGLKELENELEERLTVIREKIANEIEIAHEQGDLSENAPYKAAMDDKEFNEERIEQLKNMIKNAVVMKSKPNNSKVDIGEDFVLVRLSDKNKMHYKLVGTSEANPTEGKISIESPIGAAVYGKEFDSIIEIELPSGVEKFEIKRPKK